MNPLLAAFGAAGAAGVAAPVLLDFAERFKRDADKFRTGNGTGGYPFIDLKAIGMDPDMSLGLLELRRNAAQAESPEEPSAPVSPAPAPPVQQAVPQAVPQVTTQQAAAPAQQQASPMVADSMPVIGADYANEGGLLGGGGSKGDSQWDIFKGLMKDWATLGERPDVGIPDLKNYKDVSQNYGILQSLSRARGQQAAKPGQMQGAQNEYLAGLLSGLF